MIKICDIYIVFNGIGKPRETVACAKPLLRWSAY
jgi:hypothetical protein